MQTESVEPTIYRIPEENYPDLLDSLKRLQRRAKKLGSEEIVLTKVGHEDYQGYQNGPSSKVTFFAPGINPNMNCSLGYWALSERVRRYHLVTITGPSPILNGWVFVGAIDVIRDDSGTVLGNMVRTLPERTMPEVYRTAKPHCDHCGIDRRWKSTYIVLHEDGTYSQVGRQCLKDFTGHKSPEALASMAEVLMELSGLMDIAEEDNYEGGSGGRGKERFSVKAILTHVAAIVRTDGWVSKRYSEESGRTSTVTTLRSWLYASPKESEWFVKRYDINENDRKTATDTLEWLVSLSERADTLSDYEHNLSLFGLAGSVEDKAFGLVASAIPAFMRAHEREVFVKKQRLVSNYVGEVGKRQEMTLTVVSLQYIDSDYGTRTMCKYIDEAGNVIIWWTSNAIETELDTVIRAKVTVKKHDEYSGVKQTTVSRLTVIETISLPTGSEQSKEVVYEGVNL